MELLAEIDEADNKAEFIEYDEAEEGAGGTAAIGPFASTESLPKDILENPNIKSAKKQHLMDQQDQQQQGQQQQDVQSSKSANSAGKGDSFRLEVGEDGDGEEEMG